MENIELHKRIEDCFQVRSKKDVRIYKDGKWFELRVWRKGGQAIVRYWGSRDEDVDALYSSINVGDVVKIIGKVDEFNGTRYISVSRRDYADAEVSVSGCDAWDVNLSIDDEDWIAETPEELESEFWKLCDSLSNRWLRSLIDAIFGAQEFWNMFRVAPAALSHHSDYAHGLLHHTVNVAEIAKSAAERYPGVDQELVLAGALLHDIGKVREYDISGVFRESDEGVLMGHLYLGAKMIEDACSTISGFPEELRKKLVHIVLSHHGRVDMGWGSARSPATAEALLVAYADNMDSQVMEYLKAKNENGGDVFFHRGFGWIYGD